MENSIIQIQNNLLAVAGALGTRKRGLTLKFIPLSFNPRDLHSSTLTKDEFSQVTAHLAKGIGLDRSLLFTAVRTSSAFFDDGVVTQVNFNFAFDLGLRGEYYPGIVKDYKGYSSSPGGSGFRLQVMVQLTRTLLSTIDVDIEVGEHGLPDFSSIKWLSRVASLEMEREKEAIDNLLNNLRARLDNLGYNLYDFMAAWIPVSERIRARYLNA